MPADGLDPSTTACNSPTTTALGYTHMTSQLPSPSSLELGPSWSWGGASVQSHIPGPGPVEPKLPGPGDPRGSPGTKKGPVTPIYDNSQRELDL